MPWSTSDSPKRLPAAAGYSSDEKFSPPPLGLALIACYLGLWGLIFAVMTIFVVAQILSSPGSLTTEALVTAFGSIPLLHVLSACMLAASYGLFMRRAWAGRFAAFVITSAGLGIALLLALGRTEAAETVAAGINCVLLLLALLYVERQSVSAYLRGYNQAPPTAQEPITSSWDEDSGGQWLGWLFLMLCLAVAGYVLTYLLKLA